MPQHKSAKKRVKTNLKSQARNRAARSTLKTKLKELHDMPEDSKEQAVKEHQAVMDKAVNKGIVHRNKAARMKSRFSRGSK